MAPPRDAAARAAWTASRSNAYGHLFDAFWSPITNERTDEYGPQTLENRMRFSLEVLQEIRRQVGNDYIVGLRMVADETVEDGLTRKDGLAIARHMADSGLIDFINVIQGYIGSDEFASRTSFPAWARRPARISTWRAR